MNPALTFRCGGVGFKRAGKLVKLLILSDIS
jgi:hypothetical protein